MYLNIYISIIWVMFIPKVLFSELMKSPQEEMSAATE